MTEPARTMAASLANIDAHRPDEPRAYLDKAANVLHLVRSKAIDIDSAWRRQRAALRDELVKLDQVHDRDMTRLADMERRLEIMRGEG